MAYSFFENFLVGAWAGAVFTIAAANIIKNNMPASATGGLVGSSIVVAALAWQKNKQSADVAATSN